MNKLLVEVKVPAIGSIYDVYIPDRAKVFELTPLIVSAVERLSDGLFLSGNAVLCDGNTGEIYGSTMTVEALQLKIGSRLILI